MKLQQYVDNLLEIIKDNPDYAELEVVYASDSEGNSFHSVGFSPSIGHYSNGEFRNAEDDDDEYYEEAEPNAVCIN